jgi:hypothetical protein
VNTNMVKTVTITIPPYPQSAFNVDVALTLQEIVLLLSGRQTRFTLDDAKRRTEEIMKKLEQEHYRQLAEQEAAERKCYDI